MIKSKICEECDGKTRKIHNYKGRFICTKCFKKKYLILNPGTWIEDFEKSIKTKQKLIPIQIELIIDIPLELHEKLKEKRPYRKYLTNLILDDLKSKSVVESDIKNHPTKIMNGVVWFKLSLALTEKEYELMKKRQKVLFGEYQHPNQRYIKHLILQDLNG